MANRNMNDGSRDRGAERNFDKEAKELIQGLSERQLYELFKIAHQASQKSCSVERAKELTAVKKAIRQSKGIEKYRLSRIMNGISVRDGKKRKSKRWSIYSTQEKGVIVITI